MGTLSTVPIDYPLAFEVLVASVFNDLFAPPKKPEKFDVNSTEVIATPKKPKEVSDFFFDTPIYGDWEDFTCASKMVKLPRVTASPRIDANGDSVLPDETKCIVRGKLNSLRGKAGWLLPRPKSSSPGVIYICIPAK